MLSTSNFFTDLARAKKFHMHTSTHAHTHTLARAHALKLNPTRTPKRTHKYILTQNTYAH